MWWIVAAIIAVVSVAPITIMYFADRVKPMDIVNDPSVYARMQIVVGVLVVGSTAELAWVIYGVVTAIKAG